MQMQMQMQMHAYVYAYVNVNVYVLAYGVGANTFISHRIHRVRIPAGVVKFDIADFSIKCP